MFLSGYLTYLSMPPNPDPVDGGDQVCFHPDILTYFSMLPNPDPFMEAIRYVFIRIF